MSSDNSDDPNYASGDRWRVRAITAGLAEARTRHAELLNRFRLRLSQNEEYRMHMDRMRMVNRSVLVEMTMTRDALRGDG